MVSSARYWWSKRASGTQGRVSLFFLPQNSCHVSAVQLCYKEALYMYLGHLPDFLKEKKQRQKNLSAGAPDLRNMEAVSGWAALNAGRQIYNWAGRKLMANPDDGMGYLFLPIFPSSHSSVPHESWVSRTLCFHNTLYFAPSTDLNWNFCMVLYAKIEPDCMKW